MCSRKYGKTQGRNSSKRKGKDNYDVTLGRTVTSNTAGEGGAGRAWAREQNPLRRRRADSCRTTRRVGRSGGVRIWSGGVRIWSVGVRSREGPNVATPTTTTNHTTPLPPLFLCCCCWSVTVLFVCLFVCSSVRLFVYSSVRLLGSGVGAGA